MMDWLKPSTRPQVIAGQVDIWRVPLEGEFPDASLLLSADEQERAARFHFDRHRGRFISARAYLRCLVGWYVGRDPRDVVFAYGEKGKPRLAGDAGGLAFNLAHSGQVALYGFTRGAEIGVDVEKVRDGPAEEGIAERFFSRVECRELAALDPAGRRAAFFRCWTRKEAFVKAHGEGLGFGLDQFSVSLGPEEPARLIETAYDAADKDRWTLGTIDPGEGYAGAFAVRDEVTDLRCYWAAAEPPDTSATGE